MKKNIRLAMADAILIVLVSLFTIWIKPGNTGYYIDSYEYGFALFIGVWIMVSIIFNKFKVKKSTKLKKLNKQIIFSNFIILSLITILMYTFRSLNYSRFIVLGTVGLATLAELLFINLVYYFRKTRPINGFSTTPEGKYYNNQLIMEPPRKINGNEVLVDLDEVPENKGLDDTLVNEFGEDIYSFIIKHIDLENPHNLLIATTTRFNIAKQADHFYKSIINLKRINDIRYLNKFFEAVNYKLPNGGLFIDYVETKEQRKQRLLKKYFPGFNYLFYVFDFILKRVFPKFSLTKGIYFFLTRGQNRVLTKAETYGRLYSCGFELVGEQVINRNLYFIARKVKAPVYDANPTYGPIVKLKRIGKEGKIIQVYKLRTMHPYAEYLQEYVYNNNRLKEGGKFQEDFRISNLGKIFRKLWLDEFPMIINLLKGDIKLVGVRPLSKHYFSLYDDELQQKRIHFKPGLVPPFYADMPKTLEEIMESEKNYLKAYEKKPFATDVKYFSKAFYNILFRQARSS